MTHLLYTVQCLVLLLIPFSLFSQGLANNTDAYLEKAKVFLWNNQNDSAYYYANELYVGSPPMDKKALWAIGEVFMAVTDYQKALGSFEKALAIWEQEMGVERDDEYSKILQSAAEAATFLEDWDKSLAFSKEAFLHCRAMYNMEEEPYLDALAQWGNIMKQTGKVGEVDKIHAYTKEVLDDFFPDKLSFLNHLNTLSELLKSAGDYVQAAGIEQWRLFGISNKYGQESLEYAFQLVNLGMAIEKTGHIEQAAAYLQEASKKIMAYYRGPFLELPIVQKEINALQTSPYLDYLASFLQRNHKAHESLANNFYPLFALMKKSVLETTRLYANLLFQENEPEYANYRKLKAQYYALLETNADPTLLASKKNELNDQETYLLKNTNHRAVATVFPHFTIRQLSEKLAADEALVEFVRFDYYDQEYTDQISYAVFIFDRQHPDKPHLSFLTFNTKNEQTYLQTYRYKIKSRAAPDPNSYLRFWEPFSEFLAGKEKVYCIPDGIFHMMSLNTLQKYDENHQLIFLGGEVDIRLLFSVRHFFPSVYKSTMPTAPVLIGNPAYNGENQAPVLITNHQSLDLEKERGEIYPLPGTEEEILHIAEILKKCAQNPKVILGEEANEKTLQACKSPLFLHIATHGYFANNHAQLPEALRLQANPENYNGHPLLRAGLVLAGALNKKQPNQMENGFFSAYEVENMNLSSTQLVVLSACETGLGDMKNNEGVYGLQRAFRKAGAEAILISLWKVPDEWTSRLMERFYFYWLAEKNDKGAALRLAQAEIRLVKEHPYYWGGFVLIGE